MYEPVCEDYSGLMVCRWLINQCMQDQEESTWQRCYSKKLAESLKRAIQYLSSLFRKTSTVGAILAPVQIVTGYVSRDSIYCEIPATYLSWMRKCPLLAQLIINNCRVLSTTTPIPVEKYRSLHDKLVVITEKTLRNTLGDLYSHREEERVIVRRGEDILYRLTLLHGGKQYVVTGRPDLVCYFDLEDAIHRAEKLRDTTLLSIVVEVTLNPTIKHIVLGEMLFYMLAESLLHGVRVVGFVASKSQLAMIIPYIPEEPRNITKSLAFRLLSLFRERDLEDVIHRAEKLRAKKPWMCNLCDVRSLCPLGAEI